ncbi:hypothetical protein COLSTE_02115, partial [Collinsella stercoris DSM 13279]
MNIGTQGTTNIVRARGGTCTHCKKRTKAGILAPITLRWKRPLPQITRKCNELSGWSSRP